MKTTNRRAPGGLPHRSSTRAGQRDKTVMASDPLRREAENRWAESEQTAVKRQHRGKAKSRARAKRKESAKQQQDEIARLTEKLEEAEQALSHQRGSNKGHERGK